MNLEAIISDDPAIIRTAIIDSVRTRTSFDTIKLNALLEAMERFKEDPDLRDIIIQLNTHLNLHVKPVHAKMLGERLEGSVRYKSAKTKARQLEPNRVKPNVFPKRPTTPLKIG